MQLSALCNLLSCAPATTGKRGQVEKPGNSRGGHDRPAGYQSAAVFLLTAKKGILLRMKLTAVLILTVALQVGATGNAQNITLQVKDAPLEVVFRDINRQSSYIFWYEDVLLQKSHPVNLFVKDRQLTDVLDMLFKDQPLTYEIIGKTIAIKEKAPPLLPWDAILLPPMEVTGKITDEQGEPLEGVTILIKGTNRSYVSGKGGAFTIPQVDDNAVLVISGVNIETREIALKGKRSADGKLTLNIAVKNKVASMTEVSVVASTGYQQISRERATGSYDVIDRNLLDKRPVTNLSTALLGTVAGMQATENADGTAAFLIRGAGTLYADRQPLVVVDGFPITASDFSNINPNDVESVTVLKDAAAASIWGARSANGVIVITTKRAKANQKMNVEVNAFVRTGDRINLDRLLAQASSQDQVAYEKLAWENEWFFFPYSPSFSNIGYPLTLAQEYLQAHSVGDISDQELNTQLDRLANTSNRDQIRDLLMRKPLLQQYNLSLSTATDRSSTYASVLYEKNLDQFIKNGYNRFMMNFRNNFQVGQRINFFFGATLQYRDQDNSGATVSELQGLSPYEMLLNEDGSYAVNLNSYNREQMALLPLEDFPYADWTYNLLREVRGRDYTSEDLSARLQAGVNIKILDGLSFDSKIQYEKRKTNYDNYDNEETFYVRNMVNTMTEYNNSTKVVGRQFIPSGGILRSGNTDERSYVFRNQLSYNKDLGAKHMVSAIAGMEISEYLTTGVTNPYAYGYDPEKLTASVPQYGYGSSVDPLTNFTGYTATISGSAPAFSWRNDRYVSYYGNASYTYNSKYVLSGSLRNDASNFITDDPALRWSPLWSVGGMWHLYKENFMKQARFVDRLSMRFTYGKNGNVEKSTSTKTLISVGNTISSTTGTITASIADNGNPFLTWEKTVTANLGIDFSLFHNKLYGKIDLYNRQGKDIMGTVALPAATGTTSQRFNNAGIVNRGVELELGTTIDIPNTNIVYNTTVTYAYNRNRINDLYYPSYYAYALIDGAFVEGKPVNSIYSYTYLGMKDGVPQVAGPDGVPNPFNDITIHNRGLGFQFLNYEGTSTPPHTLGWMNNFTYKNLNLFVLFTGTFGGVYRNPIFNYATTVGSSKTFVDMYVHDVLAGDPSLPGFANKGETYLYRWDRFAPNLNTLIQSSSFIECKEISLQYNIPAAASALRMKSLRVFVQLRDLGLVWAANDKGYHPNWLPGSNRPVTSYTAGANLQF